MFFLISVNDQNETNRIIHSECFLNLRLLDRVRHAKLGK